MRGKRWHRFTVTDRVDEGLQRYSEALGWAGIGKEHGTLCAGMHVPYAPDALDREIVHRGGWLEQRGGETA